MPVVVALLCGVTAGALTAGVARRWPSITAPRVSPRTLLVEAGRHRSLGRLLWGRVDAVRVGGLALGIALVTTIMGATLIGLLLWMVRTNTGLARYDLSAARWGAEHASAGSTEVLRALSELGGTVGPLLIVAGVVTLVMRRVRLANVIAFLAVVMTGSWLLVAGVKAIVDRVRPDFSQLTGFAGASFPSGHAATAAATFAAVALLLGQGRSRPVQALLAGGAVALAVIVAATRVLLGVHWVTDVLAGLALGWTWFALTSIAFGGRLVRFAEPLEAAERVLSRPGAVD